MLIDWNYVFFCYCIQFWFNTITFWFIWLFYFIFFWVSVATKLLLFLRTGDLVLLSFYLGHPIMFSGDQDAVCFGFFDQVYSWSRWLYVSILYESSFCLVNRSWQQLVTEFPRKYMWVKNINTTLPESSCYIAWGVSFLNGISYGSCYIVYSKCLVRT